VVFTAHRTLGSYEDASIVVERLPDGPRKVVVTGGYHGRYLPSGHVVYVHDGTLFALPFDLARLEANGAAVPVIETWRLPAHRGGPARRLEPGDARLPGGPRG
jgi:serine/threonine-protein kinase